MLFQRKWQTSVLQSPSTIIISGSSSYLDLLSPLCLPLRTLYLFSQNNFLAQSHACLLSFTACLSFHSGESPSKWIAPEKPDVVSLLTTQSQLWIYLQYARGKPRSKQNVWCTNQRRSGRQRCYSSCTYKANDRKWWCYENAYLPTQAPWNPGNRPIAKIFG